MYNDECGGTEEWHGGGDAAYLREVWVWHSGATVACGGCVSAPGVVVEHDDEAEVFSAVGGCGAWCCDVCFDSGVVAECLCAFFAAVDDECVFSGDVVYVVEVPEV